MKKYTQGISRDVSEFADDVHALLTATADVAEDAVVEARKRLAAALESGKDAYESLEEEVADGAKAADKVIRAYPYQAVGVAFCIGALFGLLFTRRD
jgi:ElaB/YqjD/DUF883 family membrane-anchored ribosome-binding protein